MAVDTPISLLDAIMFSAGRPRVRSVGTVIKPPPPTIASIKPAKNVARISKIRL